MTDTEKLEAVKERLIQALLDGQEANQAVLDGQESIDFDLGLIYVKALDDIAVIVGAVT